MAAALGILGATAAVAHATGTGGTIDVTALTTAQKTALKTRLYTWDAPAGGTLFDAAAGSGATTAEVADGALIADVGAGVLPALSGAALVVGVGAVTAYAVWKVSTPGGLMYRLINGDPAGTGSFNATWDGYVMASGCYDLARSGLGTCPATAAYWRLHATSGYNPECDTTTNCAALEGSLPGFNVDRNTAHTGCSCPGRYLYKQMLNGAEGMHWSNSDASAYAAAPSGNRVDNSSFTPPASPSAITDTQLADAVKALYADPGNTRPQSPKQKAAIDVLKADAAAAGTYTAPDCAGLTLAACQSAFSGAGSTVTIGSTTASFSGADVTKPAQTVITQSPGAGVSTSGSASVTVTLNPAAADMPLSVFRPLVGETYGDYIARLQAAGWLGAAVFHDLDASTAVPGWGPNGVPRVGVRVGTASTPTVYESGSWPGTTALTVPRTRRASDIDVYRNPSDIPTVTHEPTPSDPYDPGAPADDGGGVSDGDPPVVPEIVWPNFPDVSDKWPFGMVGWVSDQLDFLSTDDDSYCPEWTWNLTAFDKDLEISLCMFNPYMPALRAFLLVLSTLTMMWAMAASVLGLTAMVNNNDTLIRDRSGGENE